MKFKIGNLVKLKDDANVAKILKTKLFTVVESFIIGGDSLQVKVTDHHDSWVFFSDELEHVVTDESIRKSADKLLEEAEAVRDLNNMDKAIKEKADKYDLVAETFFMACGMIEDNESIKYIIDPETVCNAVLKILTNDINIDKERIVQKKREAINRDFNW